MCAESPRKSHSLEEDSGFSAKVISNIQGDDRHFRFAQETGFESRYLHPGCHPTSTELMFHQDEAGEALGGQQVGVPAKEGAFLG